MTSLSRPCRCICDVRHPGMAGVACERWATETRRDHEAPASANGDAIYDSCEACALAADVALGGRAADEIEAMGEGAALRFNLAPESALALVGLIQLALRHPAVQEGPRVVGKAFVDMTAELFGPERPALGAYIAQGWEGPSG